MVVAVLAMPSAAFRTTPNASNPYRCGPAVTLACSVITAILEKQGTKMALF